MLHAIWLFAMAIAITIIIIFFDFLNTSDLYIQGGGGGGGMVLHMQTGSIGKRAIHNVGEFCVSREPKKDA